MDNLEAPRRYIINPPKIYIAKGAVPFVIPEKVKHVQNPPGMGVCKKCGIQFKKRKGFKKHCSRECRRFYFPKKTPKPEPTLVQKPSPVKKRPDLVAKYNFYKSREWLNLRFQVLAKYGRTCMLCGIEAKPPHVDHIKPKIKYPELALDFNNLQVLCADCNMGKDWKFENDFRPVT